MTQPTLFELPEQKYIPFPDPYNLKGQEKKEALDEMSRFTVKYHSIEKPTSIDKRHFFNACTYLEKDALQTEQKIRLSVMMYRKMLQSLIEDELETFKTLVKLRFMETYQKEIADKQFTPQMSKDLDKITKMEEKACYSISGIDILMKDCEICGKCQKKATPQKKVEVKTVRQQELRVKKETDKEIDELLEKEYEEDEEESDEKTLDEIIKEEEGDDESLAEQNERLG